MYQKFPIRKDDLMMNNQNRPQIFIKTALIEDQFQAATALNHEMEIQLLEDFTHETYDMDQAMQLVKQSQAQIQMLHSPLAYGEDIDLSNIENPYTYDMAKKTCELAQRLATYYQRRMPVVFHYGGDVEELVTQPARQRAFIALIHELYQTYPEVDFCFENVTAVVFSKHPSNPPRRYRDADPYTAPNLVRWLREVFEDERRFYTVLDTCHALMTVRLLSILGQEIGLETFFQANQGLCGLIHLANARNYGIGKDHGTPFLEEDRSLLEEIMTYYRRYQFTCPLTLEINESNYLEYENYQATHQTLEQVV